MAHLTRLEWEEVRQIVAPFALAADSFMALPSLGTVNSNFRVEASGRSWFLRVNEGKAEADVAGEARLVRALGARGVPTPQPLTTSDGRTHVGFGEKWVTLFPWVPGREARGVADAALAGEALRRIHDARIDEITGGELPRNHYSLDELERRLGTFAGDARFGEIVPSLARELASARSRERGPEGLIHQDLFPDNLLVADDGGLAAILDFEQATRGPLLYDVAVALNAWCWDGERIDEAAQAALLQAYGPPPDRTLLGEECRLAAARFTITRITDVFLREGVDEDLRRRKDWRDYARRLAFWAAA
jgi:homoserine kinase type II